MTHGSLFAGIGGFDLGFERAGWETRWQVELEPFCREVLATRFPKAERFKDIRECGAHNLEAVDCITAGVPCQDVSVAGKRAGLAGERTGLFYEFARILQELRPAWFVFENVPGLFSSNHGRDFAEVLRVLMVECGYGVAWRVLNSQHFGVAQRRRRVFIVGRFGKPCPAEVLFEPAGGAGDSAAGGETGQGVAYALAASVRGTGDGHGQGWNSNYVTGPVKGNTLDGTSQHAVAYPITGHSGWRGEDRDTYIPHTGAPPDPDGVRDFTGLPPGMDSARYRALGNAVTVQVAEWIAGRILQHGGGA